MKIESLNDLMVDLIQDTYSAEVQLVKGLEKMASKASTKQLREAFENHLKETKEQIKRLEEVCQILDIKPEGEFCEVMESLIEEAEEIMKDTTDKDVLDAGLIASAQKVEHYEMANYGTIMTYANMLEDKKVAQILAKTLEEEKKADGLLTEIAKKIVNEKALA